MAHHDPDIVNRATKPELGYEYRDVDIPRIGKATFLFFGFTTIFILLSIPIYFITLNKFDFAKWGTPAREARAPELPPQPHPLLQSSSAVERDIEKLRAEESRKVNGYGWVDKEKGIAHIPVEEAMKEIAAEGVPGGGKATTR
jgi:hypothetical protein